MKASCCIRNSACNRVVDLGQWWKETTNLPLPLGGNAVRRALGPEVAARISQAIRESVAYALEHREEALNYALQFARDMDSDLADKFVGMYVNKWTLGYGDVRTRRRPGIPGSRRCRLGCSPVRPRRNSSASRWHRRRARRQTSLHRHLFSQFVS